MSSLKSAVNLADATLPDSLATTADISRLLRELEEYDEMVRQRRLGQRSKAKSGSRHSDELSNLATQWSVSLTKSADRQAMIKRLTDFKANSLVIRITFAVLPSDMGLARLIRWMRGELSPVLFLDIAVRPSLIAGCTIRSTNKLFDYSLKTRLAEADKVLGSKIKSLTGQL